MALQRGIDGDGPFRGERTARVGGAEQERRATRSSRLGEGTLACPLCDAPVALAASPVSPADAIGCPWCGHDGAVRDFLSLAAPSRPNRVVVRVVLRARPAERS